MVRGALRPILGCDQWETSFDRTEVGSAARTQCLGLHNRYPARIGQRSVRNRRPAPACAPLEMASALNARCCFDLGRNPLARDPASPHIWSIAQKEFDDDRGAEDEGD